VERVREGRKNINKGISLVFLAFIIFMSLTTLLYFLNVFIHSFYFGMISCMYLILLVALLLKRETYSVMIYLKDKERDVK